MNQILNRVQNVDPNDSDAVKEVLTSFFQNLSKNNGSSSIQWLRALQNVVNRFPKYCGSHRVATEVFLINFLSSSNYYSVVEAAKCAHALQQVRPLQDKNASAKSCWRDLMSSLCDAAHKLIDSLFSKASHMYKNSSDVEQTEQPISPLQAALKSIDNTTNEQDGAVHRNTILCTRLRNVFVFIQAMLVEVYPIPKPIRPQIILEAILRALSASGNEDSSKVTTIKVQALRTLDAIIACLGSNLIPFSALVFRFVLQTLRWSSENPSEESRKVRITAYNSLASWLETLRTLRPSADTKRAWHEELTAHIVADVTPPKHVIQLTANPHSMKNLSKKARKRLANNMLKDSNISAHMPGEKNKINVNEESNDELAIAALECAETFLVVCGLFLKPAIHKQLQELLVRECYSLHKYKAERSLALLRALEASRKSTSSKVPPPTQYCLQLYSTLLHDSQREVSKFCSQALLDIRLHLHCSPPSLNFALEPQTNRQKRDVKKNQISERNRAALENLLGKERMPSQDLEEVITIPDEPTAKKTKNADISDQISLSSESADEISDDDLNDIEIIEDRQGDEDIRLTEPVTNIEETNGNKPTSDDEIDGATTQNEPENLTPPEENYKKSIYEATTQLPLHISNDTMDGEKSPVSMEVVYDYPNTGNDKVNVIDKIDDENLPSTNETDDIQITCGQVIKSPLEDWNKNKDDVIEVPKENGVDKSPQKLLQNGDVNEKDIVEIGVTVESKIEPNNTDVTVEDMLADFVDEVNDEVLTPA